MRRRAASSASTISGLRDHGQATVRGVRPPGRRAGRRPGSGRGRRSGRGTRSVARRRSSASTSRRSNASSAAAKHRSAATCSAGTASESRAAAVQRSRTGAHCVGRGVGCAGSSSSAAVTATATGHHSSGSASIMRSSSQPRGRTGGNSVVRWYARSSIVGHPSSWPSASHARERRRCRAWRRCEWVVDADHHHRRVEHVRAYDAAAVAPPVGCAAAVRAGSIAATPRARAERQPVTATRGVERRVGERTRRARARDRGRAASASFTASAVVPMSTFTWIDAVLRIIVRPSGQRVSKYASIAR